MKKIKKVLAFALLLTSMACFTAFAGTGERVPTDNVALGVVYGEPKQEVKAGINPAGIFPAIETFQVKRVRLYPAYETPEAPGKVYYNKNVYVINTISGNDWGQNNMLYVSPATTEKLRHSFDEDGHVVSLWYMEMECYAANYKTPSMYEFVSLDGSKRVTEAAYNGTKTFKLLFPVQDTTEQYSNGYKGSFSYYSSGSLMKLTAGGYVYLNSNNSSAK